MGEGGGPAACRCLVSALAPPPSRPSTTRHCPMPLSPKSRLFAQSLVSRASSDLRLPFSSSSKQGRRARGPQAPCSCSSLALLVDLFPVPHPELGLDALGAGSDPCVANSAPEAWHWGWRLSGLPVVRRWAPAHRPTQRNHSAIQGWKCHCQKKVELHLE